MELKQAVIKWLIFPILVCFFTNCSKSVYINSDYGGMSKFTLYGVNFKYIEKTALSDFSIWGTYEVKDSMIYFDFKDKKKIPYNYLSNHILKQATSRNSGFQTLQLKDNKTDDPIMFASVLLKDSLSEIIVRAESGMDGSVVITNNDKIRYVEIYHEGYAKQLFNYQEYFNYNLDIKLDQLMPGGRMSDGCFLYYMDVVLGYKVDHTSTVSKFERDGIVFNMKP